MAHVLPFPLQIASARIRQTISKGKVSIDPTIILEGVSLFTFHTPMKIRAIRVGLLAAATLGSTMLFTGCVPIFKHFSEEKILAQRISGASQEQIGVRESGWADRLLVSWEPNYWHYEVKDRHYFYVTNGTRLDLPFLAREKTSLISITPINNGNWFAVSFGKTNHMSIFNQKEVLRYKPLDLGSRADPMGFIFSKIRFTDSPARIEIWIDAPGSLRKPKFDVYIFDDDLNLVEEKQDVTE